MDSLADQLRSDAERVDVDVSPELQQRIDASLRSVDPETAPSQPMRARRAVFWWTSSLTGLSAAVVAIVIMNTPWFADSVTLGRHATPPTTVADSVPSIDWKVEPAMLTSPLHAELAALQADIEKAEQKVKDDIGL